MRRRYGRRRRRSGFRRRGMSRRRRVRGIKIGWRM